MYIDCFKREFQELFIKNCFNLSVCSRNITNWHGVIQSPNNPHDYPHNSRCEWTIIAPMGYRIKWTFTQFEMEYYHNSCELDYLEITQIGYFDNELEKKKYCGNSAGILPPPFSSFSEVVKIK